MSYENSNLIKYSIIIFIFFFHIRNIYINNKGIKIDADNIMNISFFEDDINFSKYTTNIKSIALYYPNYYTIQLNKKQSFSQWEIIKNAKPLYEGHDQPRIPINMEYYDLSKPDIIKKQIDLAKKHGIYGFGIYYYWFSGKKYYEKTMEFIFENKNIDFHYLLIWSNKNLKINNEIKIKQKYEDNYAEKFFDDIKKYLNDSRYIRNNGKPIIGLYKPEKIIDLKITISIWRQRAKESGIGEIFILGRINNKNYENIINSKELDGLYENPPNIIFQKDLMKNKFSYYYYGLLYENNNFEDLLNNYTLYKSVMLEYDNSPKKPKYINILEDFSPEKFYMINKLIIDWTVNKYDKNNRFFFINSWNNWIEGTYLEPDKKFGYSSINSLSKALFNLPFKNKIYNLINLQNEAKILIQVHIFYEDLTNEIIEKTNNIPVKFDLYITTNTLEKQIFIKNIIQKNSKANNYEIKIVENKGRDVLPYLTQIKNIVKNYKYICHLHSKKTKFDPFLGEKWRNYLYNNLFGDKYLISEILSDFENDNKLGIIFPETYYFEKENVKKYNKNNIKYMNYLLRNMFKDNNYIIGEKIIFPSGNMFWARIQAVYQIFELEIENKCPREANQYDATIMHGVERLWLFVAKLNGYYYKTIFKYK